jgi:chromosome partitioning protein
MHTIVLAIQKGGTGKSTLAVGLAVAALQDGRSVRLIETDPQGTLLNWKKRRSQIDPLVDAVGGVAELEYKLRIFARDDVALTIIDTASGIHDVTNAAIRRADLCLIPVRPSIIDIEAAAPTLGTIRANCKSFAFVLNHTPVRGKRIDAAARTLDDQAAPDLGSVLAQPYISMRNHHQDALAMGLAVSEYAPSGKSADELCRLWQWVAGKLDQTSEIERLSRIDATAVSVLPPDTYRPALSGKVSLPSRFMDF